MLVNAWKQDHKVTFMQRYIPIVVTLVCIKGIHFRVMVESRPKTLLSSLVLHIVVLCTDRPVKLRNFEDGTCGTGEKVITGCVYFLYNDHDTLKITVQHYLLLFLTPCSLLKVFLHHFASGVYQILQWIEWSISPTSSMPPTPSNWQTLTFPGMRSKTGGFSEDEQWGISYSTGGESLTLQVD